MNCNTGITLIKTGKLSTEQILEIGNKAEDSDVWQTIVQTEKLSTEQMLEIGNKAEDSDVWQAIVNVLKA